MASNNVALNLPNALVVKFDEVLDHYGLSNAELVRICVGSFLSHTDALTQEEIWDLIRKYRRFPRRKKSDELELDFVTAEG